MTYGLKMENPTIRCKKRKKENHICSKGKVLIIEYLSKKFSTQIINDLWYNPIFGIIYSMALLLFSC